MRRIRSLAALLAAVMVVTIGYGFVAGDFGDEGRAILDLAWGRVTLIDLYVGLALFSGWIVMRERRTVVVLPWVVAFAVLGNLATALYVLLAAARSRSAVEFLTGSPSV